MKTLLILPLFLLASCNAVDVLVDKSQIKGETETHYLAPSSAITPVVNVDEINSKVENAIADAIIKVDAAK
tara:strand:- start:33944 stop:34156 length:213 start_codon:yes stop_codon:yes gene_type:complete